MNNETPVEIELKLILPSPDAEEAVITALSARGYKVKKLRAVRNVDLYLDTFDWSLLKEKLSLRYRLAGGKAMYTVKGLGAIKEGIARRMETEFVLDAPVPLPGKIPVKKIAELVDGIIHPRGLLEQLQIRTDRRPYRLTTPEGAKLELAFDASGFSLKGLRGQRNARKLYELEAELKSGPEAALDALSSLLTGTFGYAPSTGSKFECALKRLNVTIPSKKPPAQYTVRLDDRLAMAVRKILAHQWMRFAEQLPGVRRDIDTEFVHQARVATRRMRSAMRLFRDAVAEGTGTQLAADLRWLGTLFGNVRDLDVFLLNLPVFKVQAEWFPAKQKTLIEGRVADLRRGALQALAAGLASPRYERFTRLLERLLASPLPLRPRAPLALKPAGEVAPAIIREKFAAVMKRGQDVLADPKPKGFHALRIQMKRLRYACEFMAPAYGSALDSFIERTVEIQDCLGEMQDAVFTQAFVEGLFEDWKGRLIEPETVFILGEIYQLQGEIARDRRARFGPVWERFASAETAAELEAVLRGAVSATPGH
jgi:triphosphatase